MQEQDVFTALFFLLIDVAVHCLCADFEPAAVSQPFRGRFSKRFDHLLAGVVFNTVKRAESSHNHSFEFHTQFLNLILHRNYLFSYISGMIEDILKRSRSSAQGLDQIRKCLAQKQSQMQDQQQDQQGLRKKYDSFYEKHAQQLALIKCQKQHVLDQIKQSQTVNTGSQRQKLDILKQIHKCLTNNSPKQARQRLLTNISLLASLKQAYPGINYSTNMQQHFKSLTKPLLIKKLSQIEFNKAAVAQNFSKLGLFGYQQINENAVTLWMNQIFDILGAVGMPKYCQQALVIRQLQQGQGCFSFQRQIILTHQNFADMFEKYLRVLLSNTKIIANISKQLQDITKCTYIVKMLAKQRNDLISGNIIELFERFRSVCIQTFFTSQQLIKKGQKILNQIFTQLHYQHGFELLPLDFRHTLLFAKLVFPKRRFPFLIGKAISMASEDEQLSLINKLLYSCAQFSKRTFVGDQLLLDSSRMLCKQAKQPTVINECLRVYLHLLANSNASQ